MKNKKGFSQMYAVLIALAVLTLFYIILYLPFPAFTKLRLSLNYYGILALLVVVQVGIIAGYYYLGKYAYMGFSKLKSSFQNITNFYKKWLITRF